MRFLLLAFLCLFSIKASAAHDLDLAELFKSNAKIDGALISVYGPNNTLLRDMRWQISKLRATVLLNRIERMTELEEENFPTSVPTPKHPEYNYIKVQLINVDRKLYEPIYIVKNWIYPGDKTRYFKDNDQEFEYWLMSTSITVKQLQNANNLMQINTYNNCVRIGNNFDQTSPEKCYMADGSIFYNTNEEFVAKDYKIMNFEDCVEAGYESTKKYPRRCVSKGRVYLAPFALR